MSILFKRVSALSEGLIPKWLSESHLPDLYHIIIPPSKDVVELTKSSVQPIALKEKLSATSTGNAEKLSAAPLPTPTRFSEGLKPLTLVETQRKREIIKMLESRKESQATRSKNNSGLKPLNLVNKMIEEEFNKIIDKIPGAWPRDQGVRTSK